MNSDPLRNLKHLFSQCFKENPAFKRHLKKHFVQGKNLYRQFNQFRMKIALDSFSSEMKSAFFDILFFLHTNEERFGNYKRIVTISEKYGGQKKGRKMNTYDLYVPDCSVGILNIDNLDPLIQESFYEYVQENFETEIKVSRNPIFNSIASLGSIGTIAHKKNKSDLDLQVQYDFNLGYQETFETEASEIKSNFVKIADFLSEKNQVSSNQTLSELNKKFPRLHLFYERKYPEKQIGNLSFTARLAKEFETYQALIQKTLYKEGLDEKEKKVKEKIQKIQSYLDSVYPDEEIFLFAYSCENYRKGLHGSTLDSKESSGSAYELILNYETLMPGIQFTPQIPTHFLLSEQCNNNSNLYALMMGSIGADSISDIFSYNETSYVNLGATRKLTTSYMEDHFGAVYWEAFKGSSGNLPKAFLNLQRLEILFNEEYQVSIIELIKKTNFYEKKVPQTFEKEDEFGLTIDENDGLSISELMVLENKFNKLKFDPWWLRYKTIKFWIYESKTFPGAEQKKEVSKITDICFALHVWIIDVLDKQGSYIDYKDYREVFLKNFYDMAFPPITPKRELIEKIFIGEIDTVNRFEMALKGMFNDTVNRVLVRKNPEKEDLLKKEEYKIWFHYYSTYFLPKFERINKSILRHLKHARGRLKVVYEKEEWSFRSVQEIDRRGKRFDTFGTLKYEPEQVDLHRSSSLFKGIVHCIFNGYYGFPKNAASLKKSSTVIELKATNYQYANDTEKKMALVRPETLEILATTIHRNFEYLSIDYKDCLTKEFVVRDAIFCFNILKFGSINLLYRDMLGNLYVEHHTDDTMRRNINYFFDDPYKLFRSKVSHKIIKQFLLKFYKNQKLNLGSGNKRFDRLHFWWNPITFGTNISKFEKLSNDLSEQFKNLFIDSISS